MYQGLVGVHHLLQVDGFVAVVGESGIGIKLLVGFDDVLYGRWCLDDSGTEDTTGEVTTIGDEVDVGIEIALYLFQTLADGSPRCADAGRACRCSGCCCARRNGS